jgi:TIR domain
MAFVSGYQNDVFVSYARLDNLGESAWVSTLIEKVDMEVRQRLGTKDFKIWFDADIHGNQPLTSQLVDTVRRSATLLVVMSPGYLASEWCTKERNAFLGLVRDCVSTGRIFIVNCRDTQRDRLTTVPEFGDLLGFKFWTEDTEARTTRPLGVPDPKERAYLASVLNLSDCLAQTLRGIKGNSNHAAQTVPQTNAKRVFVARTTDDLEAREEELRGYLTQAGLGILPEVWYPETTEQDFRAAMEADLARSAVFVQLLGRLQGRKAEFAGGRRYASLQSEIARSSSTPVLQWRDGEDDPASVPDVAHRALLEGARTCGFAEFERAVVDSANRKPSVSKPPSAHVTVFVNADRDDLSVAKELSELLAKQGIECFWPLLEGSPEKVRLDLEDNLTTCDGLVLIYGAAEPSWVRNQLRQGRKILSQREHDLAALAIYLGPPPQKPELAFAMPEIITLDGRVGLNPESLRPFVERLTAS